MGAFFSLGRYFTVNEDNSLVDKIVNNKLEKVQNSSMTSGHVNTADIIPTLWLYLCSFFFLWASLRAVEQKPAPLLQLFDFC